jgi:anti-sigma28 factor (negative regulator of flagellin synthesis)
LRGQIKRHPQRRRKFLNKKERERLKQRIAAEESKARAGSQARQERIKVLWDAITPGELARDAKDLADNELVRSLIEIVQRQKSEIE